MACASNPRSLFNVFVYGSLLHDDVVRALLKRLPHSSPAILHDFHRFSIKGCVYPAILPVQNKKVKGKVLSGITIPELDILDKFEDVEYERRTVVVTLTNVSSKQTYQFTKQYISSLNRHISSLNNCIEISMNTSRFRERLENRPLLTFSLKRLSLRPHIGDF
ncbi:putative L-arabinokinase-like [Capsicum annuum]|nr:putative L-arabinokinase-like [Capsicum annuum]